MKKKYSFKNELGNQIETKIKKVTTEGTKSKTGEEVSFDAISLSIVGPNSMTENIITFQEGEKLHQLLGLFLERHGTKSPLHKS